MAKLDLRSPSAQTTFQNDLMTTFNIGPRVANEIIKTVLLIDPENLGPNNYSPTLQEAMARYERKIETSPTSAGVPAIPKPVARFREEDLAEGNVGINVYGSSFEPPSDLER